MMEERKNGLYAMSSPRKFSSPEIIEILKLIQVVAERKSKVTLLGFRTEPRSQVKNIEHIEGECVFV